MDDAGEVRVYQVLGHNDRIDLTIRVLLTRIRLLHFRAFAFSLFERSIEFIGNGTFGVL